MRLRFTICFFKRTALTNAHLQEIQSSGIDEYNPGEAVAYECNDGFNLDPSIPLPECFCNDNLDGTASWICAHQGTTTVCVASKQLVILFLCRAVLLTPL